MQRGETPTNADVYQSTTDQIIAEFKEKIEEIDRELGCASENVVALMREEGRISDQQAEEAISRIVALKSKKAAYMGFIRNAEENTGNADIAFSQAESASRGSPSNGRVVPDREQIINQQPHVSDKNEIFGCKKTEVACGLDTQSIKKQRRGVIFFTVFAWIMAMIINSSYGIAYSLAFVFAYVLVSVIIRFFILRRPLHSESFPVICILLGGVVPYLIMTFGSLSYYSDASKTNVNPDALKNDIHESTSESENAPIVFWVFLFGAFLLVVFAAVMEFVASI